MTQDNYWPEQAEGGWKLEVPRASSATALAAQMGMTKGELDAAGKDEVLQVMRASKMYVNFSHAWFLNYAKPAASRLSLAGRPRYLNRGHAGQQSSAAPRAPAGGAAVYGCVYN